MQRRIYCLILAALFFGSVSYADSRSAYDNYVSTYNAYKAAVEEGKSPKEISKLLDAYKAAQVKYENSINMQKDSLYQTLQKPEKPQVNSASSGVPSEVTSEEEQTSSTKKKKLSIDDKLKKIVEEMWSDEGRKDPDEHIQKLNEYLAENPTGQDADVAKYEMAKAFELLKNDSKTSEKLLKEIGQTGSKSPVAALAAERLKYLQAGAKNLEWKDAMQQTHRVAQEHHDNYKAVSWLAFPVKISRWFSFAGKSINFDKTQSNYQEWLITYEEIASKFVPPVEITFDKYMRDHKKEDQLDEGSTVVLRYDNPSAWYTRWKLLNDASESIEMQYYIMSPDIFGHSILGLLHKKAEEGVNIRLMLDVRGSLKITGFLRDILQELKEFKNVEIKTYNRLTSNTLSMFGDFRKIMSSNHDKIVVVDKEYAIVGGRNIAREYFSDESDYPGAFRDCDVLIKNPTVASQLQNAFLAEFNGIKANDLKKEAFNLRSQKDRLDAAYDCMDNYIRGDLVDLRSSDSRLYKKHVSKFTKMLKEYKKLSDYANFNLYENAVTAPVQIIDKTSISGAFNDITEEMVKYIDGSSKEIIIQNPYVVLTERIFGALKRASDRGVPIILHTNSPASTDSAATQGMFYADWKRILQEIPTIKIYVFTGTKKLHAKNWVFDRKIGVVGTYNLDYMSEQINSEVVAAVKSKDFAKQLRTGILSDVSKSSQYKYGYNEKGEFESVGPDNFKSKNMWLIKAISKLDFFKFLI